jgi:hypothetical protein
MMEVLLLQILDFTAAKPLDEGSCGSASKKRWRDARFSQRGSRRFKSFGIEAMLSGIYVPTSQSGLAPPSGHCVCKHY